MIHTFVDEGLGNSSYLVDLGDGRALAIDPTRDPSPYLHAASARGLKVAYTVDTHLHADFVSGSRELAALGATILAPSQARVAFEHRGLHDDEEVDLGGLTLRAIGTPGHTPEHLSYLLLDDKRPVALFSGGALIVGSIARTDLVAPEQTEPLTRSAFRAARERLATFPDELGVYPTHGAGSFCSAAGGGERATTMGHERSTNPVFLAPSEDAFVRGLLDGLGTYPHYFLRLAQVNRSGPRLFGKEPPTLPLLGRAPDGAVVVDTRPFETFAAGHIARSVSIEFRPAFSSWLGWVIDYNHPIALVLEADQDRRAVVRECLKIGYENLVGEVRLDGDLATIPVVEPQNATGTIVDVRQRSELATGVIPGAVHVEAGAITGAPEGPLTLHCAHGQRAAMATSLLARTGRRDVSIMRGGAEEWSRSHQTPLVQTT